MKVLVCGSRDWTDMRTIRERIAQLPPDTLVIHGAARGADTLAAEAALARGLTCDPHPADWNRYGRSAGFRRNAEMIALEPDLVLAFQRAGSRGTQHTIDLAKAKGIPTEVFVA